MPPTVKIKEKKQQPVGIQVQSQEGVSQIQNVPQGMNGAARIQSIRQERPRTRFSILEEEVMNIADEANKQTTLMKQKLTDLGYLNNLIKTNQEKLTNQDKDRKINEDDLNQIIDELTTAVWKNRKELLNTAAAICNLKREQMEKQVELTEEAMRECHMEITDEWRDEAQVGILRETIKAWEIFEGEDLVKYKSVVFFDGSEIEELKDELASVERRMKYRKELDAGARSIAAGAEQHKKSADSKGYKKVPMEALNKMVLEFTNRLSQQKTREQLLNPVYIRNSIEPSLTMLDIWKADRKKRSKKKLTKEERERYKRADQIMTYYEQHVNTVLGDYGMSLDRLSYSKKNINELAKRTQNAERIDAWNRDYEAYQSLFGGEQENRNPDAENLGLSMSEKRLRELERRAGIVNTSELKKEVPVYDIETSKKFLAPLTKQQRKNNTFYSVFRLQKDVLSSTKERKQVENKEIRLCYVCAKILCDLKSKHLEKEDLQFEEILPLVNKMVKSYEAYDIRSYVQRQQWLRKNLMEKLGQIQRTSPIFQERQYATLILGYLHSEQMGELVKGGMAEEVRVYDKSYGDFGVQLEKDDRFYTDRLKSVKNEPLFAHDPMLKDIHQGALGDCYFLAALASIVSKNPETIKEMMKDNGNGTVTVRFYDYVKDDDFLGDGKTHRKAYYVTVDKTIPERTYKDTHSKVDPYSKGALWVKMMEKAYAAVRNKKDDKYNNLRVRGKGESINYKEIEGGQFSRAMVHLTGEKASIFKDFEKDKENPIQAFQGHFTGKGPVVEGKILDSPSELYFYKQHDKKRDKIAMKYLAQKEMSYPKNLEAQFKKELDGYKNIEAMMEKALRSQVKLLEIQAMDTKTYMDTMDKLGAYLKKLISQLKVSNGQELSDKMLDSLQDYDWEGNKTIRTKKLEFKHKDGGQKSSKKNKDTGGGQIRLKAFEDIGYKLLRDCWKVSGKNADKLFNMIDEMLKIYKGALEYYNRDSIYTEAELGIFNAFAKGLDGEKKCSFGTKKFDAVDGKGVAGENTLKGMCGTHAYTVLSLEEHEINKQKKKFLRVQNPHGGNIPLYIVDEDENGKTTVQRRRNPKNSIDGIKFEKATNGVCLIELRDACSAMRTMTIV